MNFLPSKVILNILQFLASNSDGFSFATATKWNWDCCCSLEIYSYRLNKTTDALEFNQLRDITIANIPYKPSLLKHVFRAPHLRSVSFDDGQEFSLRFMAMIFDYIGCEKQVIFYVPKRAVKRFQQALVIDEMKNITVRGHCTDQDDIDNRSSKRIKSKVCNLPRLRALYNPIQYQEYENTFSSDPLMQKGKQLSVKEADLIVEKYAPAFVESILMMGGYWFYLTGYSAFVHQKQVDDLADRSKYGHQDSAVGFIRRKTQKGSETFEYTIRIGVLELMAVSGFYGRCDEEDDDYTPFLGSALKFSVSLTQTVETICSKNSSNCPC